MKQFLSQILDQKETRDRVSDRKTMRWIYDQTKGVRLRILFFTFSSGIAAVLSVVSALATKSLIDGATNKDKAMLIASIAFVGVLTLSQLALSTATGAVRTYTEAKLKINFQKRLLSKLLKKDFSRIATFHSGELLTRMFSDVSQITGSMLGFLPSIASLVFQLITAIGVLVVMAPQFIVWCLGAGVCLCAGMLLFRGRFKGMHKRVQEAVGELRSFLQEVTSSMLVIKVFGRDKEIEKKTEEYQHKYFAAQMRRRFVSIVLHTGMGLAMQIGAFVILIWGCFAVYSGSMTFGTMIAMVQLIAQVATPFTSVSGIISGLYRVLASAERIMELEAWPDEPEEENRSREAQYAELSAIRFDDVSFTYGRNQVLDHVNMEIRKGDIAAFTGLSGGGKSTMFLLMLGAYHATEGRVFFDYGSESHDPDKGTRKMFAYVPQGNYLFSGTLRENLTFFRDDIGDDAIHAALREACAEDFVAELPQGLDTVLGEKGHGLSEGQMQRVAIARALLSGAPILLLDEATSALDEDTEAKLLEHIAAMKDRTCLIVTHRRAALAICNRHFLLKDGRVSEAERAE